MVYIPRNLPHAALIAERLERRLVALQLDGDPEAEKIWQDLESLQQLLGKYVGETDPPDSEAAPVANDAAQLARNIVEELERLNTKEDRLGQTIRNLFECLGFAEEGLEISLRAGEDPNSLMRPK